MFYDGVKKYDLGSRAHVLKHLHGRIIFGPFEKVFHDNKKWVLYLASRAETFFLGLY